VTRSWLNTCEKVFNLLRLSDATRRELASWHLQGEASNWWGVIIVETDESTITWVEFKRKFEAKLFSEI